MANLQRQQTAINILLPLSQITSPTLWLLCSLTWSTVKIRADLLLWDLINILCQNGNGEFETSQKGGKWES